jgi:molecular chaperone GrpE (heat shock protein)
LSFLLTSFISPAKALGMTVSVLIVVPLLILVASIIITGTALTIFFLNKKSKDAAGQSIQDKTDSGTASSFLKLRDSLEKISGQIPEIGSQLDNIRLDLEDYTAQNLKNEEELKEKYYRMTDNLFLLLDHLEIYKKNNKKSDKINWFHEKTRWILEQEGIEEIPVARGDSFNGIYHQEINSHPHKLPDGTILEVLSKGYYKKGKTENDDIILRPARVTVSSGPQKDNISKKKEEVNNE